MNSTLLKRKNGAARWGGCTHLRLLIWEGLLILLRRKSDSQKGATGGDERRDTLIRRVPSSRTSSVFHVLPTLGWDRCSCVKVPAHLMRASIFVSDMCLSAIRDLT